MVRTAKSELLDLMRKIPLGRVASVDCVGKEIGVPPALVYTMLSQLSEDERELVPWHRIVAKGGAIGRGPHRDQQFARLVREGVMVSPAGIVQDLLRFMVSAFPAEPLPNAEPAATPPAAPGSQGRSRGMKLRP